MSLVETTPAKAAVSTPDEGSLRDHTRNYFARVRGGEMGALPAVFGLVVLCIFFAVSNSTFLTSRNFANLFTQGAQTTVIAMGLVFVLLLGEIDLSAGYASGVCASVLAVLLTQHNVPWYLSVLAAVGTGVVIGVVLGFLVAKIGIPSFVVTLAAFLAFQGVALLVIGDGQNISIHDKVIVAVDNNNMPEWLGWVLLLVVVLGYAGAQVVRRQGRISRGLAAVPMSLIGIKVLALAVVGGFSVYVLNLDRSPTIVPLRGVPIIVPFLAILLLIWTFVLGRTKYGRHVYAVGGSKEAALRAGIAVDRIRISAFVICSGMAAIGGIVAASRGNSVDPNTGGSSTLLYAVGAAVIGGTSLFGGKGRVLDAVLGGAVVAVIDNGMGLLGKSAGTKFVFTGVVLLLAAGVDALSRRRAAASGLR